MNVVNGEVCCWFLGVFRVRSCWNACVQAMTLVSSTPRHLPAWALALAGVFLFNMLCVTTQESGESI